MLLAASARLCITQGQVFHIDHSAWQTLWPDMDIFHTRYYTVNVTLLSIIGLWPYQKFKTWQLFQQIMCPISLITVMMSQGIKLLEEWGDLDIMIECLTPMGVHLGACIKFFNSIVNRKKMIELLEKIKSDWSSLQNEEEIKILTKYAEQGRNLSITYTGFLYCTIFMYLVIPLLPGILDVIVPLNESRPSRALYHTQYYVDPEEYYLWIFLHTYSGTLVTVTCVIAADTMFVCYVMHACGILAIIGNRLEKLTSKNWDKYEQVGGGGGGGDRRMTSTGDADSRCFEEITYCIDQHYRITEAVKMIEASYSMSYLLTLGVAMVLLSISAVQLLIKLGQVEEMIRLFQFNLAQFSHLLFNSWPGQKLIDQSVDFRKSLYAAEWYSFSERNKHLLRFVMMRTVEPQKITAGKLYIMSMENFGVIIQTSMSYFTVFASVA